MLSVALRRSLSVMMLLPTSVALAGPLAFDPTGIPQFTGSVAFNASNQLLVDLDYAVFAPGVYPDDGVNGDDPSNGAEYVYAYQAFNRTASTRALTTVSVGLVNDQTGAHNAVPDPLHVLTGGVLPSSMEVNLVSLSVITRFLNPPVPAGGYSSVFLFTSPNRPTYMTTSVLSGGLVDTQMAPSPLPEPATFGLLALGGLVVLRRRRA